jgi:hypothetical protein
LEKSGIRPSTIVLSDDKMHHDTFFLAHVQNNALRHQLNSDWLLHQSRH